MNLPSANGARQASIDCVTMNREHQLENLFAGNKHAQNYVVGRLATVL